MRKRRNPARTAVTILLPVMIAAAPFCAQEALEDAPLITDPGIIADADQISEEIGAESSLDPIREDAAPWEGVDPEDAASWEGVDLEDAASWGEVALEEDASWGSIDPQEDDPSENLDLTGENPDGIEETDFPDVSKDPSEEWVDVLEASEENEDLIPEEEGSKDLIRIGGFSLPEVIYTLEDLPDSEDLYEGYAASVFAAPSDGTAAHAKGARRIRKVPRGSLLEGQAALVYERLKERVLQVAAGEEQSTVVTISLEDLGVCSRYSAQDLGLETLTGSDKATVTQEAREALNAKLQVEMYGVLGALMADFPYELYWYDKTVGIAFAAPSIGLYAAGDREYLIFEGIAPQVQFSMTVMTTYRVGPYETDLKKTGAALQAAQNARDLVAQCAELKDMEKLEAYRDYILEQVSYATWAVTQYAQDGIYADPWQMIYVFDEDPQTNVVCEGYAKAFQYLCDQTTFDDPTIICELVSGDIYTDGGGGGAHMWNNVRIGDRVFLTDLTNCDSDEGYHYPELFLGGTDQTVSDSDGDTGYLFDLGNEEYILYFYDSETLVLYTQEELSVSTLSYAKLQAGSETKSGGSAQQESETGKTGEQEKENDGTGPQGGKGSEDTNGAKEGEDAGKEGASSAGAALEKTLTALEKQNKEREALLKKLETTYQKLKLQSKKVAGVKVRAKKKTLLVSWKKLTGADGYEVYVSLKKGRGYKKAAAVSGKKAKAVIRKLKGKKLKTGKVYYVKVRAYRRIAGKRVYTKFGSVGKTRIH